MSNAIFPTLIGLAFPVTRTVQWSADIQESIAGMENRLSYYTYPRYQYDIDVNVLQANSIQDFQTLIGFINSRQGSFDSFLYMDTYDNFVSSQLIGSSTGSSTVFQLIKSFGGFIEPVLAPNTSSAITVYLNGVSSAASSYTINGWGTSSANGAGSLVFNSAPSSGTAITATFGYYYPCRFVNDKQAFSNMYSNIYNAKKISFITVKN
jgi:uncharacterized protein (TIGR02217 family)